MASALVAFLMLPAAAAADDLIVIPVSGFASGGEGDVITIATVNVPEENVGATCQIVGRTVNQVSVHPGNDLLIVTNGQTFVVPDFEDAGFIEHEAGEVTAVGSTITLQIRFGPDGVSSGGFRVQLDCEPENTTTTMTPEPSTPLVPEEPPAGPTTEAPTTTEAPATTTAAPTTSAPTTAVPTTEGTESPDTSVKSNSPTTAEAPPAGPTTEAPTTTEATTTTAAPTTSAPTTAVPTTAVPTTAAAPVSEEPPAGPQAEDDAALPITGSSTGLLVGFGAVFVAAGVVLRRFASLAA